MVTDAHKSINSENHVTVIVASVSETKTNFEQVSRLSSRKHSRKSNIVVKKEVNENARVVTAPSRHSVLHTPVHSPIKSLPFSPSQVV